MDKKKLTIWIVVASIIIAGLGAASWYVWYLRQPVIPISIHNQLSFSPLAYVGGSYQAKSYKYDPKEEILSYLLKGKDGSMITVTEQSQPPQFIEIPDYKDKFLDNVMKRYSTVQSSNNIVYLTRPPKQDGQVGVIIDKGLLVFLKSSQDLSESQWRKLADRLVVERAGDGG